MYCCCPFPLPTIIVEASSILGARMAGPSGRGRGGAHQTASYCVRPYEFVLASSRLRFFVHFLAFHIRILQHPRCVPYGTQVPKMDHPRIRKLSILRYPSLHFGLWPPSVGHWLSPTRTSFFTILKNKRARVSLTLRLICGYLLRSLLTFLTFILLNITGRLNVQLI